jgi:thiamine-phosphate pyrophosphorylase
VHGLYVITAPESSPTTEEMLRDVASAIRGGASLVQYRRKDGRAETRRQEASQLAALCRTHGVSFIVNDDVVLARDVGASGIHLGEQDAPVPAAREALGAEALIGMSCYDSLERALAAQASGADYVAFGSFFPSPTKPAAARASLELLRQARARLRIPVVAIGGITPKNAPALIEAGADAIAVISGVFGRPDVEAAARRYAGLFP